MYVNIPKYGKDTAMKAAAQLVPNRHEGKQQNEAPHRGQHQATRGSTSYVAVVARDRYNAGQPKGLYKEDTKRAESRSSLHLDIPLNDKQWFRQAWVGRLKDLRWYDRLKEDPLWDFGAEITPKYMGDDMVFLLRLTDAIAKRMVKEAMEEEDSMFYSLEKWHPNLRTGKRLTWVHCGGIPLVAWDRKYIQQIVAAIGDLVDVDDVTKEARRVDHARVLIRTPWSPAIHHIVSVDIGGEAYQVQVVEELSRSPDTCNCWRRREMWSSEEIDSDDRCLGTPIKDTTGASSDDETQGMKGHGKVVELRRTPSADKAGAETANVEDPQSHFTQWSTHR